MPLLGEESLFCNIIYSWLFGTDLLTWKEIRNPLYLTTNKRTWFCGIGN